MPTDDPKKKELAQKHLADAIRHYRELLEIAPANIYAQLGHAWCVEQSGDKPAAIKAYRAFLENDVSWGMLGWRQLAVESINYLLPLLDKEKDAAEIQKLQRQLAELEKPQVRHQTPIIVPLRLDAALHELINTQARVTFDADGSGLRRKWTWILPNAGWLVCAVSSISCG
jgi:tetratricopeptide (TPR) repeat protein